MNIVVTQYLRLFVMALLTLFMEVTQAQVRISNCGINGNNTEDLLKRASKDVLEKKPDLVIIMIGTNDMLNLRNMISLEQYKTNYHALVKLLKQHSAVMLMTAPPVNSEYIIERQGADCYPDSSPQEKIIKANSVVKETGKMFKCQVLDLYQVLQAFGGSGADKESLFQNVANFGINDGVHPTSAGYRVIGTAVATAVQSLFPNAKNIVCFGDSITFGYKMQGQGTINGDSYPAVLNRILNNKLSSNE